MGYAQAGFEVVGIDIEPQPDYPFKFIRHDVIQFLNLAPKISGVSSKHVTLIHASPPCQAYTSTTGNMPNARKNLPRLIEPTRELLLKTGLPYVIEGVVGSPLKTPTKFCGSMFGLGIQYDGPSAPHDWYELRRHRLLETNWDLQPPDTCAGKHRKPVIGIYGNHPAYNRRKYGVGKGQFSRRESVGLAQQTLGIPWCSTWTSLKEAIPPAYTEYVGVNFLASVTSQTPTACTPSAACE